MAYGDELRAQRSRTGARAPGKDRVRKEVRAIRNRLGKALITSAATAAIIGMAAAPAFATAATWTVKPGGATTGKAGTTTVTDTTAGQSVSCTSSSAKGTFKNGSGLSGAGIGTISTLTVSGCSVLGMNISVTITGKMPVNALSFNATKKTVSMTLTKIHGSLSTSGCSATIDGTGATAHNGKVKATYADVGGKLHVLATGGNLHLFNVNCFGVINNGDSVNFTTTYTLTPKQVITSP